MTTVNQFIVDNIASLVMGGFFLVVITLIVIATLLSKSRTTYMPSFTVDLENHINRLKCAAEHYVDVSAVVTMMSQLDKMDKDALALLVSYPEAVRAAALLHYVNCLGADLQAAQRHLSNAHQEKGKYSSGAGFFGNIANARHECQSHVDDIRAKLDVATVLREEITGSHSV